jgi:AcrR family transcriptional regulator
MPKPSGRTNAQASDETRRALLDATLACIAEEGYAKASTTEIAARAGVSRGALVHHFPAKADLIAAAVHHLFERGTETFLRDFTALEADARTYERAIEQLWAVFSADNFRAGLHLIAAGSADLELQLVIHTAVENFRRDVIRVVGELFPEAASQPLAETAVVFGFSVILGSSVYRQLGLTRFAEDSVATLRILTQLSTAELAAAELAAQRERV